MVCEGTRVIKTEDGKNESNESTSNNGIKKWCHYTETVQDFPDVCLVTRGVLQADDSLEQEIDSKEFSPEESDIVKVNDGDGCPRRRYFNKAGCHRAAIRHASGLCIDLLHRSDTCQTLLTHRNVAQQARRKRP